MESFIYFKNKVAVVLVVGMVGGVREAGRIRQAVRFMEAGEVGEESR